MAGSENPGVTQHSCHLTASCSKRFIEVLTQIEGCGLNTVRKTGAVGMIWERDKYRNGCRLVFGL